MNTCFVQLLKKYVQAGYELNQSMLCLFLSKQKKNKQKKHPGGRVSTQGPGVQSILSLISSLMVKMLTVLISNLQMQKLLTFFFSKNVSLYAIFNDKSFYNMLTKDIVSFEQKSPGLRIMRS